MGRSIIERCRFDYGSMKAPRCRVLLEAREEQADVQHDHGRARDSDRLLHLRRGLRSAEVQAATTRTPRQPGRRMSQRSTRWFAA